MDRETLDKATVLKSQIRELDNFIYPAQKTWTGKLQIRKKKMFFKSDAYGYVNSVELELDAKLKNEILNFIIAKRDKLEEELGKL